MKFNKIFSKKTLVLCVMSLTVSGCSDFLTRDHPTGVTDKEFWKTMNECENALGQCKYWPQGTLNGTAPNVCLVHMEGMTDNEYFLSNFCSDVIDLGNGAVTPTRGGYILNVWKNYYIFIRRCNRFLEHVGDAYFTKETERQRMIADVKVWRAWYHIQLLLWYGRNDGIPIVEKSLESDDIYQPRNSVEECLTFINKELDEVIAITNDEVAPFIWDEGNRGRMSRSVALALKMDVNLQFHKYDVAKAAAKQIIDSGVFELYYSKTEVKTPEQHFYELFNYAGEQNKERIMFTADGLKENWFRCMGGPLGGQGTCAVLKSLVDEFETVDGIALNTLPADERLQYEKNPFYNKRDPRLSVTVMVPGDNTSISKYTYEPFKESSGDYIGKTGAVRSGYMMRKFLSERDRATGRGSLDFMLYRYAEVLLDYVECLVESDDWQNPDVEKYINMIRNRAGMPNMDKLVYNSQDKVRELYRRERRVEFAFEGKRYHDIRRWGIGEKTMSGPIYGAWNPNTNAFVTIEERNCLFPKNDSWPLSQQEVTANPNIKQPIGW